MSKKKKGETLQLALSLLEGGGLLADILDFAAAAIVAIIRKSAYSREQICDKLTILLGRNITVAQLGAWTAETNRNRMPADVLLALCLVLNDFSPLKTLLAPLGLAIADKHEQALAELGRVQIEREQLAAREQAARRIIEGKN